MVRSILCQGRMEQVRSLLLMDEAAKRRVTLLDIAADAGVSRATASLVIRNVSSVAEGTRRRVLKSIKRLGYVYHSGAANLRTQRSNAVGLIVSDITNPFFAEASVAIEERLAASNYVTLLGNTSEDRAKEDRVLKTMREFPAQGILICPALERDGSGGASALAGRLPIVAFARRAPGLDYAGVDDAQGAQLAVEHLYKLHYRRIAFIGGSASSRRVRSALKGIARPSPGPVLNLTRSWLFRRIQRAAEVTTACEGFCRSKIARLRLSVLTTWSLSALSKLSSSPASKSVRALGSSDLTIFRMQRTVFRV